MRYTLDIYIRYLHEIWSDFIFFAEKSPNKIAIEGAAGGPAAGVGHGEEGAKSPRGKPRDHQGSNAKAIAALGARKIEKTWRTWHDLLVYIYIYIHTYIIYHIYIYHIYIIIYTCICRYIHIMCVYIYTYIRTYMHKYIHTYIRYNFIRLIWVFLYMLFFISGDLFKGMPIRVCQIIFVYVSLVRFLRCLKK